MSDKFSYYKSVLDRKHEQNRFKQLRFFLTKNNKQEAINFQSLDFLDLSSHPYIKKNTIKYILEFGVGSQNARFIPHHLELQTRIEKKLAYLNGFESTTFMQHDRNIHHHILQVLTHPKCLLFVDKGCNPLIAKAALESNAKVIWYEHNTPTHLEMLLKEQSGYSKYTKIILSESIFSNTGDLCYIKALTSLSKEHNALLYIDDSYSFGIMGENGVGFSSHKKGIDLVVSGFGRPYSLYGFFLATNDLLKDYFLEVSSDLAAMRLLPPAHLGAIDAILDLLPDMETERQMLQKNSQYLRRTLKEKGFSIGPCTSHIVPLFFEDKSHAENLQDFLMQKNILCTLVYTNAQQPIIKFAVHASHKKEEIDRLLQTLISWKKPLVYETL